jgi:thioredoxin reductase (NADPH)
MAKPVILAVDDDSDVLHAVERDLRRHYSENYRILASSSGPAALELLKRLQQRNESVALLLVDHRMPQMTGVEFLSEALRMNSEPKRVLLTAYADTDAAIRAINEIHLNHYLLKPWDPPEEHLYPVIDELLDDWQQDHRPPFEGLRVLGTRWSARCYELRDFLSRNQVPFQWIDIEAAEHDKRVRDLLESLGAQLPALPLVILADGTQLSEPAPQALAEHIGLRFHPDANFYDVVIVGGGPAGLAAAVYAASEGLRAILVEREAPGGQAALSSRIENYLGFPSGLSGAELTRRAVAQARRFGAEILSPQEVAGLRVEGRYRYVKLTDGTELACNALLIATGVQWRKLNVPGIDRLQGAGVYYGAGAVEASSCKGEDVYIVGGANSAGQAAIHFARYARQVTMLVRGESLAASMSKYLIDEIQRTSNIRVDFCSAVKEVHGEVHLEAITVERYTTATSEKIPATSLFIFIGAEPGTNWLAGLVERDEHGFIQTGQLVMHDGKPPLGWPFDRDPAMFETSVPGIFAVGDVRGGSIKRVAASVGEGSAAIHFVHRYLGEV